ncbi:MAG TPA: hypothetical protein VKS80_01760 [Trinickia sp.]|nr:hypothetical protein [Trinickia sp.]
MRKIAIALAVAGTTLFAATPASAYYHHWHHCHHVWHRHHWHRYCHW